MHTTNEFRDLFHKIISAKTTSLRVDYAVTKFSILSVTGHEDCAYSFEWVDSLLVVLVGEFSGLREDGRLMR